uniref:Autophagy protein 5 n=1 Tax=Lynceus sp. MCZ IZ 141354 TaxID=1930659 RepID=A0A9N6ZG51_9CRUS|nr:EOG090X0BB3 [Lynceus sp. MCZ IZ 141354]
MAEDKEVLREVWEGRLPVCFTLAQEEVFTTPEPYYLMVPRLSYFPLVTDKVKRHFLRYVAADKHENEMWLEYEDTPLKWHYPIGVLFDMSHVESLPWNITVHFDKFPEMKLIRGSNTREAVESQWMACLKEADALKHKGLVISQMQKKDQHSLWQGLLNDKFDQFWSVNRKLMESQEGFKHIPFRLYVPDSDTRPYIQALVKPVSESGSKMTLLQLIQEALHDDVIEQNIKVITHGVEVPLDSPVQWLSEHLSYPDSFLHLHLRYIHS